jgi:molybdenum-dependent DNA-binding transcriptional regulator ModE
MMKQKTVTKEELEKIYKENSASAAAKKLGISIASLYTYLNEMGIALKGRGGKKKKKLWIIG